jgi:hypothetical protein
MTSISAAGGSSYQSPLQKLQQELQAELTSGKISSGDQDALSAALDSIDQSMQADRGSASSGTRPSPDDMKSKIDDLISAQVSSGTLTSDQADELKGVFEAAFADGPGGARGAGGPPPGGGPGGPPPSDNSDDTDGTTDINDIMQQFLNSLKQSLEASTSSSYSASGITASGTTASFTALLVDYKS